MLNRKGLALALAVGATFAAPLAAYADPSHFAPTEAGVTYHPEHAGAGMSSTEVSAELEAARKQANWDAVSRLGASPARPKGDAGKTSAQVSAELEAARQQPNWDAVSRLGAAPVSPKKGTGNASAEVSRQVPWHSRHD